LLQALIEGLGITLSKMASPPPPSMPFPQPGMPGGPPVGAEGMAGLPPPPIGGDAAAAAAAGGSEGGGWFSWLTGGEEQKVRTRLNSSSMLVVKPSETPDPCMQRCCDAGWLWPAGA
jgi:hypothetical protein